jgi:hypothetical protein
MQSLAPPETKWCPHCEEFLPLDMFYKDSSSPDGREFWCKEKRKKSVRATIARSPDHYAEYRSQWGKNNRNRSRISEKKAYQKKRLNNPGALQAKVRTRQATQMQRTPRWADLKAIEEFYRDCPKGYEIDHWAPLQGEIVSGLHVFENLQYLTPAENRRKNNRFPWPVPEGHRKYFKASK